MKAISVENLSLSFDDKQILKQINIDVKYGESLVIIGGSGSGKSLLLKSIIGLVKPNAGIIKVDKKKDGFFSKVTEYWGVLFQNCALFDSLTVKDNIAFNLQKRFKDNKINIINIVEEKLSIVGLDSKVMSMYPSELSGGMKKRVALARVLAGNPKIIMLDEPTEGLDPIMADIVNNIIVKCHKILKLTIITITHDIKSAITIGDNIAMLHDGRIIFKETVEKFLNSNNHYVKKFIKYATL